MESINNSQGLWQNGTAPRAQLLGLKLLLIATAIAWLSLVGIAWSEAAGIPDSEGDSDALSRESKSDEYNFSWLDPEKKIYVLQNRKYVKTGHPILSVMGGGSMSNSYRNVYSVDGRFAYYLSEWLGIEAFYTNFFNSTNSTFTALSKASTGMPSIREIQSQVGAMVHFVPWYAKINVFNAILYFDWYFGVGLASMSTQVDLRQNFSAAANYSPQSLLGVTLSTGNEYYFSRSFIFRWDVTGTVYSAPVSGLSGESTMFSNINFAAGLGWRI